MDNFEVERRDRNYRLLNDIIDKLGDLSVFPSLVWLWSWDVAKHEYHQYKDGTDDYYQTNSIYTEKDVWDMFWEDADKNGFSLEYGSEDLHEAVRDWMIDRDIIITIEEEDEDEDI